jgi:hypothetical protein
VPELCGCSQAQNWCQAMCLNASRTRRRLRRLLDDWNNLGGHAALADAAPGVVSALERAGWRWQGLGAEDPQARRCRAGRWSQDVIVSTCPRLPSPWGWLTSHMMRAHCFSNAIDLRSMAGPIADANFPQLKN